MSTTNDSQLRKNLRLAAKVKRGDTSDVFSIVINGKQYTESEVDPELSLCDYVRHHVNLTGTKKSCAEGGCGACSVLLSYHDETKGQDVSISINSCLRPLLACNGMKVTTIEGLGSRAAGYSDIQQRLADFNGTQCGFCSPGWVVNMQSLLNKNPTPTALEVEQYFDGNLCRCTGYRPILSAFKTFAVSSDSAPQKTCSGSCSPDVEDLVNDKKGGCCNKKSKAVQRTIVYDGITWLTPTSLDQLYSYLNQYEPATTKMIIGNTSSGIYKDDKPTVYIDLQNITTLKTYSSSGTGLTVGSTVTISDFIDILTALQTTLSSVQGSFLQGLINQVKRIAGTQIRNAGCIGGNIMMAHNYNFTSDLYVALMGLGATFTVGSSSGTQTGISCTDFYAYNMDRKALLSVYIPYSVSNQHYQCYKIALRHVMAHSLINCSCNVIVDSSFRVTTQPYLAFGGLQPQIMRMTKTEQYLVGKTLTSSGTLSGALEILDSEAIPDSSFGRDEYRKSLVTSFFYQFYLSLLPNLSPELQSAINQYQRPLSGGTESFQTDPSEWPVSKPMPKRMAIEQTSGESQYTDDLPIAPNTLFAAFVISTEGSANVACVDASVALGMTGVVDFVTASDINGANEAGNGVPIFATDNILYNGQPIGLIIADSQQHANEAAQYVKVTYSNVKTPIVSLEDAIAKSSFWPVPGAIYGSPVETGDIQTGFSQSDYVITGTASVGSQYHFHLETQTCAVQPEDDGTFTVYAASQWPQSVQSVVASALLRNCSDVNVVVKRVGGGFGGKITNASWMAAAVAIASAKLSKPIRTQVDLNSNMRMLGKRAPITANYKVGFMADGTIKSLYFHADVDAGCAPNDALGDAFAMVKNLDNAYNWPNFRAEARICKTNLPANTSVRGPGWVPAVFFAEHIMEHIASYLNNPALPAYKIKAKNFYNAGATTPDGAKLTYWNLDSVWDQLIASSDFENRLAGVETYNAQNYWSKKGLSIVPVKWSVYTQGAFHTTLLNVYGDGTVTVCHSGIEIGQGIDIKVLQTVAYELGIDMNFIRIGTSNSISTPNGGATGGSTTSELCCQAAATACQELLARLAPIRNYLYQEKAKDCSSSALKTLNRKNSKLKGGFDASTWQELISKALSLGMDLQVIGTVYPTDSAQGAMVQYFSYGAVVTQVHVDVLSGRVDIERCDILFDCGTSLNPTIDLGQIEGGFVYGLGYYLSEELLYDTTTGQLTTDGTWEYKPPSAMDIPIDFRVALLKNSPNPNGFLSSKAVGEPPLGLSCSVVFALQQAIASARSQFLAQVPGSQNGWMSKDSKASTNSSIYFDFSPPASVDKIQQSCNFSYNDFYF